MQRHKAIVLIIVGVILAILGFLIGNNILPKALQRKMKTMVCVDSQQSENYRSWVGSLSTYSENLAMRVTFWNITNKEGFLYHGEIPVVKEVGPYVYRVASKKKDIVFSGEDVSYKSLSHTKYDAAATKSLCAKCEETDMLTVPNAAYVTFALQAGGDRQMASMFIPVAVQFLLSAANRTGFTTAQALQHFGNFSSTLLTAAVPGAPAGWYPAGFGPWFSKQNKTTGSPLYGILNNSKINGYNLTEMMAFNSVITTPSLLGTTGNKSLLAQCTENQIAEGCGFLFYLQAYNTRKKQGFPSNDTVLQRIFQRIQDLFCKSPSSCLMLDTATFTALSMYVSVHLAKLSIHLAIDRLDFGPLMTRSVKQISHGYTETDLKIPNRFPTGFPVKGLLPTDTESSSKPTWKYYTCNHATKALQVKEYNNSPYVSKTTYPNTTADFRKIEGHTSSFGIKIAVPCKEVQSAPQDSFFVFDQRLMLKYRINLKGRTKVGPVYTYLYEADTFTLFKTNNMAVFRYGLIDLSKNMNGVPIVASMPHFLYGDPDLVKMFNTKPNVSAHNTYFFIEPLSGAALKGNQRSQLNLVIPEQTIKAPRQRPFNITYTEKESSRHYSQAIPLLWIDLFGVAPNKKLDAFSMVSKLVDGACASIVTGTLLGVALVVVGIVYVIRSLKTPIHSHVEEE